MFGLVQQFLTTM